jgi:membrane-bound lytic murein transglycosylase B
MKNFIKTLIILFFINCALIANSNSAQTSQGFNDWLISFKALAVKKGISVKTIDIFFKDVRFLEQVIKYDRKQPEFFEDTKTYINKRATSGRANKAKKLLLQNRKLFEKVEKEFNVDKEILLSLWGIETNFGKHVGKMDIISSLSTLSYDKRRSEFFTTQLLILLELVDKKLIDHNSLFGSWAGAFGNFQFMPSSIKSYAIDYDQNNKIELKNSLPDALASAANYINKVGWKQNEPCFYQVLLTKNINKKYINSSAKNIKNRLKLSDWKKKGVLIDGDSNLYDELKAALVIPDGKDNTPTYLVFGNYDRILKWNRSLRFGITVCTLSNMIKL